MTTVLRKTLFDPWQTFRGASGMTALTFAACMLTWLIVRSGDTQRIMASGGAEVVFVLLGCAALNAAVSALRGWLPRDPRAAQAVATFAGVALLLVAVGLLLQPLFAGWKFQNSAGRQLSVFNGWFLACLFSLPAMLLWFLFNDMRLSALEPGRDARLRKRHNAISGALISGGALASAQPKPLKWHETFGSWLVWRQSASARSQVLDVFIWPRTLLRTVIDWFALSLIGGVMLSLVIGAGWFGDPQKVGAQLEAWSNDVPGWYTFGLSLLGLGIGNMALTLARRYAPWMNRSMSACVTLVWALHVGISVLTVWLLPSQPYNSWFFPAVFVQNLMYAFVPLLTLNQRGELIQTAQRFEREQAAAVAHAQKAAAQSELRALQAQIEPHFLYNTLTNVQLLVRQDPVRADAMTGHLIDYLRARLPLMRAVSTPLASELEMVRSYLAILRIRMGERLAYEVSCPPEAEEVPVLPLSVMTLVENAVKHGLEPKRGGGSVSVSVALAGGWVAVRVADTGAGFGGATSGTGVGLTNIQERLRLTYGEERDASGGVARIDLIHNEPCGVVAELKFPAALPIDTPATLNDEEQTA